MRTIAPAFAVAVLLATRPAAAIDVGDYVLATQDADLRVPAGKTGLVFVGDLLEVESVNGKWLWVISDKGKPGWIDSGHVVHADKGQEYFAGRIAGNSKDAAAFVGRAKAFMADFAWEKAVEDLNTAVNLGHKTADVFATRGMLLAMNDEIEKALTDLNEAIRLNPSDEESMGYRGLIWEEKGQYDKAHADYSKALQLSPEDAGNMAALAMLQASCPEARFRNGRQAVTLATKACELSQWQAREYVAALAAAYAETGDFKKAVEYGQKALEIARDVEKVETQKMLDGFKANKPYRHEASAK
jgi:tetratricopeptide (TPR) repeat protein